MAQKITEIIIRLPIMILALGLLMIHLVPLGAADPPPEEAAVEVISRTEAVTAPAPMVIQEQSETVRRCENGYIYSDEIPLSDGWQCWMQECCERYGVPYTLALGVAETESSWDFDADSGYAHGLMQISPINYDWLREIGIDPETKQGNIEAGVYMLGQLLISYDVDRALMAYNCGETYAAELWAEGQTASEYSRNVRAAAERWADALR